MSTIDSETSKVKQKSQENEPRARIAIRAKKGSRLETGFTRLPNYALWFWSIILGPLPLSALAYLLSRKFDGKEDCFPSLETIAAALHVDRHRLMGRWRTTKSGLRYWDKGILEVLIKYGFLTYYTKMLNGRKKLFFIPAETIPLLTEEEVQQLPEDKREEHVKWLKRNASKLLQEDGAPWCVSAPGHGAYPHPVMVRTTSQQEHQSENEEKTNLPQESEDCAHAPQNGDKGKVVKRDKGKVIPFSKELLKMLERNARLFNERILKAEISDNECERQVRFLKEVIMKKNHRTLNEIARVMRWFDEGNYKGTVKSINILASGVFDQALSEISEAEKAKQAAEARRQAQAEWLDKGEARRVSEAENYARQQQANRQPEEQPEPQALIVIVPQAAREKTDEAHAEAVRDHGRRFRAWMEAGGEEQDFFKNNPAPRRAPRSSGFVSVGAAVQDFMVSFKSNWPATGASA